MFFSLPQSGQDVPDASDTRLVVLGILERTFDKATLPLTVRELFLDSLRRRVTEAVYYLSHEVKSAARK